VPLKGFADPVRVIQILPEDELPSGFPPLVSLVAKPSNLPLQATPFVGREREVEDLSNLLRREDLRLLTLTGPGGTGKTRLALQVAAAVLDEFERGTFFVSMASIGDPSLIASSIAATLKVREVPGQSLLETLKEYLHDRQMLLVLDNFEHVLDGAVVVAELLGACPDLKVLATSRAALHLAGEHDFAVPPLAVPDLRDPLPLDALRRYDAIALFVDRAAAAKSDFTLTDENAHPVAEICSALDGLPLAIELAAARIKVFPPQLLLQRLSRRLSLLTGGARDVPMRQQTLRATIDWSYGLLPEAEQRLFARLGVFAGGCTREAIEAVCRADALLEVDVLAGTESLVEQSLMRQSGEDEPRFGMLETIREYALYRLETTEAEPVRRRHADYFLGLALRAEPAFRSADQEVWLGRLEAEHDNMRAALAWALEHGENDLALRLGSALHRFWQVHGHLTEGRSWLEQSLARPHPVRTPVQVDALTGAGWLAIYQADFSGGRKLLEEALALARELGDDAGLAESLYALGHLTTLQGDYERARSLYGESLDLYLGLNDTWGIAAATNDLGTVALSVGDYLQARELLEEGLALARHLGQKRQVAVILFNLGYVGWCTGEYERAQALYEECLALAREIGDRLLLGMALNELGMVGALLGHDEVDARFDESLRIYRDLEHRLGMAEWLENQARVMAFRDRPERAARLHGAAHALRQSLGVPLSPSDARVHDRDLAPARSALGDRWEEEWEAGTTMTVDQGVTLALEGRRPLPMQSASH
jgi:predicted ATPase/uncharacterized protein HemY